MTWTSRFVREARRGEEGKGKMRPFLQCQQRTSARFASSPPNSIPHGRVHRVLQDGSFRLSPSEGRSLRQVGERAGGAAVFDSAWRLEASIVI